MDSRANSKSHRPQSLTVNEYVLIGALILLSLANLLFKFPGESNPDSDSQYAQIVSGRFDDWHPPIMARIWQLLSFFGDGTGPIFVYNIFLYWLAIGLIVIFLCLQNKNLAAWSVLIISAQPLLLMININITKDVTMAVMLLCAISLHFFYRYHDCSKCRALAYICSGSLLVMAILTRNNAVFIAAPVMLFMWRPAIMGRPFLMLAIAALSGLGLVPLSSMINHQVLDAKDAGAISSLQIFDIAGVFERENDDAILEGLTDKATIGEDIRRCYSPIMWDTLQYAHRNCAVLTRVNQELVNKKYLSLRSIWIDSIRHHPVAYMQHRLSHFNATTYFWVPSHHTEAVRILPSDADRKKSLKRWMIDAIRYSPLTSPAFLIAINLALIPWLITAIRHENTRPMVNFALILTWVALIYGGTFLFVGVATDQRYFFLPAVATFLSVPIALSDEKVRQLMQRNLKLLAATAALPAMALALIVLARTLLAEPL